MVKKFISGKVADLLQAMPDAASIRICFDVLKGVVIRDREEMGLEFVHLSNLISPCFVICADELQAAVQAGEINTERLRELQAKFGVTRLGTNF
jgi:hypothetical protein